MFILLEFSVLKHSVPMLVSRKEGKVGEGPDITTNYLHTFGGEGRGVPVSLVKPAVMQRFPDHNGFVSLYFLYNSSFLFLYRVLSGPIMACFDPPIAAPSGVVVVMWLAWIF